MFEPGFIPDLDEATYYADPDSLSVSGAKLLLKAPALLQWRRTHPEHKDYFDVGTVFHEKVLGTGRGYEVVDAASWRGQAAAAEQQRIRDEGHIPILAADDERTTGMAKAVRDTPEAMRWLEGAHEVSGFAPDEETGIMRRARFDCLGDVFIGDLKSTTDASPDAFARSVASYHYHQQAAWYLDLCSALGHPALGFAFVAVEKEEPYFVAVYELDSDAIELGRELNDRALDLYAECVRTGRWPGYGHGQPYQTLHLPGWAFKEAS